MISTIIKKNEQELGKNQGKRDYRREREPRVRERQERGEKRKRKTPSGSYTLGDISVISQSPNNFLFITYTHIYIAFIKILKF